MRKYIGIQPFNPWFRRACGFVFFVVDKTHILVPDSKNESPFSDGTKIIWLKAFYERTL